MSIALELPTVLQELIRLRAEGKSYEIIDGQLTEVPGMGFRESCIAMTLGTLLRIFVADRKLGVVLDSEAKYRLTREPDLVRMPDVSFVSWPRIPGRVIPRTDIVEFAPDLAVEVISPSNRASAMQQKIADYFEHGVRLVWIVYPDQRQVYVYEAIDRCRILQSEAALEGGDVLPGLRIGLPEVFADVLK